MTKQELLDSLVERRKIFEGFLRYSKVIEIDDVLELLEQIEKDVTKLDLKDSA